MDGELVGDPLERAAFQATGLQPMSVHVHRLLPKQVVTFSCSEA